jgi:hypothetical protein
MQECLKPYPEPQLIIEAARFTEAQQTAGLDVVPLDRLARRMRDGLICWFCECHSDVLEGHFVGDMTLLMRTTHRRARGYLGNRRLSSGMEHSLEEQNPNSPDDDDSSLFDWIMHNAGDFDADAA